MKPSNGKYQTATRVKVLSPEISDIREDDGFHLPEVSMWHTVTARYVSLSRGLSPWYDIEWKLQELGRALMFLARLYKVGIDKLKRQGYTEDIKAVGLTHSRGVIGVTPYESKSEGYSKGLALVCRGKVTHRPDAERGKLWKRN